MWGDQRAVINPHQPQHRLASWLLLPLGCPVARATEVPGCQVPTPSADPCGAMLAMTTSPRMLHWSTNCAPATPMHSPGSYGRGHR
jgi:hypothetical protein